MQGVKELVPKMMYQVHIDSLVPQNNSSLFWLSFRPFPPISLDNGNCRAKNDVPLKMVR